MEVARNCISIHSQTSKLGLNTLQIKHLKHFQSKQNKLIL